MVAQGGAYEHVECGNDSTRNCSGCIADPFLHVAADYRFGNSGPGRVAFQDIQSQRAGHHNWNVNYTISQVNTKISLEPGEANTISMSLAISDWIEAVDVLIELDSPHRVEGSPLRWAARCQHDLKEEV